MNPRLASARLYLVTGRSTPERLQACLDGGVDLVQLRWKDAPGVDVLREAAWMAPLCRDAGVPFLLNDRPDLVAAAGADGVHVGQDDASVAAARAAVGPGLVGLSTHAPDQLAAALELHASSTDDPPPAGGALADGARADLHALAFHAAAAVPGEPGRAGPGDVSGPPSLAPVAAPDYVAVGPVHATPTKPGRPAVGLEYVRHAAARVPDTLPWFAIGGLDPETLAPVVEAGARRIVVVRALTEAPDPAAAAAALLALLPEAVAA